MENRRKYDPQTNSRQPSSARASFPQGSHRSGSFCCLLPEILLLPGHGTLDLGFSPHAAPAKTCRRRASRGSRRFPGPSRQFADVSPRNSEWFPRSEHLAPQRFSGFPRPSDTFPRGFFTFPRAVGGCPRSAGQFPWALLLSPGFLERSPAVFKAGERQSRHSPAAFYGNAARFNVLRSKNDLPAGKPANPSPKIAQPFMAG